jgi:dihydrolipoamide dehydrogenase
MDKEISNEFMKILKKQGIKFHMQNKVEKLKKINQEQLFLQ